MCRAMRIERAESTPPPAVLMQCVNRCCIAVIGMSSTNASESASSARFSSNPVQTPFTHLMLAPASANKVCWSLNMQLKTQDPALFNSIWLHRVCTKPVIVMAIQNHRYLNVANKMPMCVRAAVSNSCGDSPVH